MSFFSHLEELYRHYGVTPTYWVAFSGGRDSHVLLHLCVLLRAQYGIALRAIHVNHQISSNAVMWAAHCDAVCQALDVPFTQHTLSFTQQAGESLEAAARDARYAVFRDMVTPGDVLLTAHHEDDQAETVLLQLLRGAGPKGLAAMPTHKIFGVGYHARPLLACSRDAIMAYANEQQLHWIHDESNNNAQFTRNFLRHHVLTTLKERWPTAATQLARVASHCAEAQEILAALAQEDFVIVQGSQSTTMSVQRLLQLTPARQRQVLRYWLSQLQLPLPSTLKLQHLQHDLLHAAEDKTPCITWPGVEMRRHRDDIYALRPIAAHDATQHYTWQVSQPLQLPSVGVLQATRVEGEGLRLPTDVVRVQFRQGGEQCSLPGRDFHHALKKLFQQWQVPTWLRDRLPLLYVGDTLVAVVGYYVHADYQVGQGEVGYVFTLKPVS